MKPRQDCESWPPAPRRVRCAALRSHGAVSDSDSRDAVCRLVFYLVCRLVSRLVWLVRLVTARPTEERGSGDACLDAAVSASVIPPSVSYAADIRSTRSYRAVPCRADSIPRPALAFPSRSFGSAYGENPPCSEVPGRHPAHIASRGDRCAPSDPSTRLTSLTSLASRPQDAADAAVC